MNHCVRWPVDRDGEVNPASQVARVDDSLRLGVGRSSASDAEDQFSFTGDLPVRFSFFEAIGKNDGTVPAVQALHLDPGRHGEGLVAAGDIEADAVGDAFEVKCPLARPAAPGPLGANDGSVRGVFPLAEQLAVPSILAFEVEEN